MWCLIIPCCLPKMLFVNLIYKLDLYHFLYLCNCFYLHFSLEVDNDMSGKEKKIKKKVRNEKMYLDRKKKRKEQSWWQFCFVLSVFLIYEFWFVRPVCDPKNHFEIHKRSVSKVEVCMAGEDLATPCKSAGRHRLQAAVGCWPWVLHSWPYYLNDNLVWPPLFKDSVIIQVITLCL